MKYAFIQRNKLVWPICVQCRVLLVSVSGYHEHRSYIKQGIFKQDPFATLDQAGVGLLVKMATAKGRNTRPNLKVGICGEHGGDPESVKFCHKIGLNYVSCSPFRLLTARLAAAQAALQELQTPDIHSGTC